MTAPRRELRRLLERATPGPWRRGYRDNARTFLNAEAVCVAKLDAPRHDADAALLVAAVNALPALLDRLEALEAAAQAVVDAPLYDGAAEEMVAAVRRLSYALRAPPPEGGRDGG